MSFILSCIATFFKCTAGGTFFGIFLLMSGFAIWATVYLYFLFYEKISNYKRNKR